MDAYTLKKKNDTEEFHLFKGEMTEKGCTSINISICEMMQKKDSEKNIFACKTENDARIECAKIGREVCGVCVSNLYTTYK